MKGLSIKQPYTSFILLKLKDVEHRTHNANFRGFFLIHSSKNPDHEFMEKYGFNKQRFVNGCLLGVAELIGVERYGEDDFGWKLDNVFKFEEPLDYKGKLGFFDVELNEPILNQLKKCLPIVHWSRIPELNKYLNPTASNIIPSKYSLKSELLM